MSSPVLRYEFERYSLLPSERLLLCENQRIPLKSKVFETLLTLLSRHGELLTKEELMQAIWGESFVEEGNLTQNIFTLRKIFGERPGDHRFIVTVPGRGYRFVAKVKEITKSKSGELPAYNGVSGNGHLKALAILPLKFLMRNEAAGKEHLGLAIADSLIARLSAGRKFSIRSTEAVTKYAGSEMDALSIGKELAVEIVLSGTILSSHEKTRTNLQLQDVKSGETLWADRFEINSGDLFELQDQISEQAARSLSLELGKNPSPKKTAEAGEIYQTYLKYRFFWESRTESGLLRSLDGAKEMVAARPDFALGQVAIADSYLLLGHHLYFPPDKVYPAVRQAVRKALEIEPGLAEAYSSKADLCFISKDWEQSEKFHKISLSLNPDNASGHHWYCWFLISMGRFDEALAQIEEAQRLDRNSMYLSTIRGIPFCYKGEYEKAISQFEMVLEIDPAYKRARYYRGWALLHSGQVKKAIAELERVVVDEPIQQTIALLAHCYGVAGMKAKAQEMLQVINRMASGRYISPYVLAQVYLGLDYKSEALSQLERAYKDDAIWLIWLNIDLQLKELRGEERFKKLLEKLNFPV